MFAKLRKGIIFVAVLIAVAGVWQWGIIAGSKQDLQDLGTDYVIGACFQCTFAVIT